MSSIILNCPHCHIPLVNKVYDLHCVDECPNCKGLLISAAQLLDHIETETKDQEIKSAPEVTVRELIRPQWLQSNLLCPKDGHKMRLINYGHDSNVLLDQCAECQTLWVENGEIFKLAQYMKRNPELMKLGEEINNRIKNQELEQHFANGPFFVSSSVHLLGDTTEPLGTPWVTVSIILLLTIVFILTSLSVDPDALLKLFALIPAEITVGSNLHTLLTYQLFHAGLLHLIFNMFSLWIFGDNVESRFGHWKFLLFYLSAGVVAGLGSVALSVNPDLPEIGASGAIAAVMGSYLYLYPKEKLRIFFGNSIWRVSVWVYMSFWIIGQFLNMLVVLSSGVAGSIGFTTHVVGFLFGFILTFFLAKTNVLIREVNFYKNPYLD